MSEPFLNPQCSEMMLYAHERGHEIWFASTLVGLSIDQWKTISDIPFNYVLLHVADENKHSHIPVTTEYKQLLQDVISACEKTAALKVFHCHGQLHREIENTVKNAKWRISYKIHDRAGHEKDPALQHRYVHEDIYCHHNGMLLQYTMLHPDGRVVLCHCDITMQYVLGNLLENEYESLFSSPLIAELRNKSQEYDSNLLCRVCQDARRKDGINFPVWEVPKWEPFRFFKDGVIKGQIDLISQKNKLHQTNLERQKSKFEAKRLADMEQQKNKLEAKRKADLARQKCELEIQRQAELARQKSKLEVQRLKELAQQKSELEDRPIFTIISMRSRKIWNRLFSKRILRKRIQKEYALLIESDMFDANYYLKNNPDVAKSGMDPLLHFIKFGWKENRNPDAQFDVAAYLEAYPDVRLSQMNPLAHYIKYGKTERRILFSLRPTVEYPPLTVDPGSPGRCDKEAP